LPNGHLAAAGTTDVAKRSGDDFRRQTLAKKTQTLAKKTLIVVINGGLQPVREALGDHIATLTERTLNR
jgi:hypothetical protein